MTPSTLWPDALVDPQTHATGDPHALWRWMREHEPVHRHPPTELPAFWSVTRYEDVRAVYADPGTFSSRQGVLLRPIARGEDAGGDLTLALTDPPRHRQLRSLMSDRFAARSARAMEAELRADIDRLLVEAIEQGEVDLAHDIAARLSIYLVCRLLGIPEADFERMFQWTHEAFMAGQPLTRHAQVMRYLIDLMYDRMERAGDDVASALANGVIDEVPLTETEILLNFENLVGATENAGLSMAAGTQALLEHPDQWRRLREEPDLVPRAVEEILRWSSSATHSMRTVTRPCRLRGQTIEEGERVVVWLPSANRDESVFAASDRFDVSRRPNRHLALGGGNHVCIGGTMARTQIRLLLTELLRLSRELEQVGPAVPLRSIAVRGPASLPVRIIPR